MSEAPTIAFVGSSGVEPSSPLPAALAAELGLRRSQWVALGIRGSRLARWTHPELPAGLRAVVVLLTANDAHPSAARVREVDAALRRLSPVVVWLPPLPYPVGSRAEGRPALMRAALGGAGVVWVDRAIRVEPGQWSPDRVHPTVGGFMAYARQVGPELAARLSALPSPSLSPLERAVQAPIGHVHTARGQRLPLTSLDAVWLARAIVGEGGTETDAYAIASTMVRRWAMLRDASAASPFESLTDLVVGRFTGADPHEGVGREVALRGYSQPVSVQWRDPAVERRRRVREMAWDAIEPWRRAAVLRVLTGRAALTAAGAVHFAAVDVVSMGLARHPGWRRVLVEGARNAFVGTTGSRRMSEPVVVGAGGVRRASPRAPQDAPVPPPASFVGPCLALALMGLGLVMARPDSHR